MSKKKNYPQNNKRLNTYNYLCTEVSIIFMNIFGHVTVKYSLLRFFIFLYLCFCSVSSWGQTDPIIYARHLHGITADHADVQADIDLYHRQVNANIYKLLKTRRHYLQQITPLDQLIADYMNRGFGVAHDTISLFTLFDGDNTIFTTEEQHSMLYEEKIECFENVIREAKRQGIITGSPTPCAKYGFAAFMVNATPKVFPTCTV